MRELPHTRRAAATALAIAFAALLTAAAAAPASARTHLPPHHRVFHGVSDTGNVLDFHAFRRQVRAHPAVLEDFYHWGTPLGTGALHRWRHTRTRGVLSLSTAPGGLPELITPGQIARGRGDDYLLGLNRQIAASGQVVYLRPFAEMNGSWNPYSAFNADGSARDANHSTARFRKAWRRMVLIVRGGPRAKVNRRLLHQGMPRILRAHSNRDPRYRHQSVPRRLPHPRVAFIWNPQTSGSPAVPGNAPSNYWPGRRYVDWVGADIYAKYATPTAFGALSALYHRYHHFPFVVGEYSPWDYDPHGGFIRELFRWARKHGHTRMLVYYRSVSPNSAFDLSHFPAARRALRHILDHHRFMKVAPGAG